jgi:hypothetical protein
MPKSSKPKPDNPEQFKRFVETARQVEVDESPDALDRALDKVLPRRDPTRQKPNRGKGETS